jgi:hypothetical protein
MAELCNCLERHLHPVLTARTLSIKLKRMRILVLNGLVHVAHRKKDSLVEGIGLDGAASHRIRGLLYVVERITTV